MKYWQVVWDEESWEWNPWGVKECYEFEKVTHLGSCLETLVNKFLESLEDTFYFWRILSTFKSLLVQGLEICSLDVFFPQVLCGFIWMSVVKFKTHFHHVTKYLTKYVLTSWYGAVVEGTKFSSCQQERQVVPKNINSLVILWANSKEYSGFLKSCSL